MEAEVVEAAVVTAVAEAEMAAHKPTFLPALVTGNAQSSTVATPILPGEMTATNAKPLNLLVLAVVMTRVVETAEEVVALAGAEAEEVSVEAIVGAAVVV